MSGYEKYTFLLCLVVFLFLVGFFTILFAIIIKSNIKLIKHGVEDNRLLKEHYEKINKTKLAKIAEFLSSAFSLIVSIFFIAIFALSFYLSYFNNNAPTGNIPIMRVVQSDSMSFKNKENEYLFENNINNQFETFDIIFTYQLPDEMDLKLYDIVVYERDDKLIVHRIVGIEEPCSTHPDSRYFLLQGDAIQYPDVYPVEYSQMKAIYTGEKVSYIGSFIVFLQSPIGWLCLILIFANLFVTPLITKRLEDLEKTRIEYLLFTDKLRKEDYEEDEGKDFLTKKEFLKRSFERKLSKINPIFKNAYASIKEKLMKTSDIKIYRSLNFETYTVGKNIVCKIGIKNKKLFISYSLNPKEYEKTKYEFKNVEKIEGLSKTPLSICLNNEFNVQNAKELIDEVVFKYNLNKPRNKKNKR